MKNCTQYLYADDFAVTSTAKHPKTIIKSLNKSLALYSKYCLDWKLKINGSKTEAIFFTRYVSHRKTPNSNFMIDGVSVPWSNKVKYLEGTPRQTFNVQVSYRKCNNES